jgi:hypothetical protein
VSLLVLAYGLCVQPAGRPPFNPNDDWVPSNERCYFDEAVARTASVASMPFVVLPRGSMLELRLKAGELVLLTG